MLSTASMTLAHRPSVRRSSRRTLGSRTSRTFGCGRAGEGLNAKKFPELGTFLGGVKVALHADFDELLAQAHAFLPMKSMPAWMQGKYPPAPAGRPRDASNGWFANHPLQKLQYYQAFLRDQAAEAAAAARAKAKEPKKKQPKAAKRSATPPAEEDDEEDRPLKKKKSEVMLLVTHS